MNSLYWDGSYTQRQGVCGTVVVTEHDYNGLHWRVVSRAGPDYGGETRRMFYSAAWQMLEEEIVPAPLSPLSGLDEGGPGLEDPPVVVARTRIFQVLWAARHVDDPVLRRHFAGEAQPGQPAPPHAVDYYHLTDPQFSTVAMISARGQHPKIVERVRYSAYGRGVYQHPADLNHDGELTQGDVDALVTLVNQGDYALDADFNRDGEITYDDIAAFVPLFTHAVLPPEGHISDPSVAGPGGVPAPDNRVGYAGYAYVPQSARYSVRFRWYDPGTGRWLQRDPLRSLSGSMNYFQYANARPVDLRDPLGLKPAGIAHPIPKALGGSPDKQICIDWTNDADAHTRQHACLARELNDGVENWKEMADAFKKLDPEARREVIRKSLVEAGVDAKVLTSEVLDGMFIDCKPGENRAKERGKPLNIMRPDGSFSKGGLAAVFIGLTAFGASEAAANTIFGSTPCRKMLDRIKRAYAGSGGCGSVDCNILENGKGDAYDCALELGAILQDEGFPNPNASASWKSLGDNYNALVAACWEAKCGSTGGSGGSDGERRR